MALASVNIPKYRKVPNGDVGVLNAASAGALGADTNGVAVYTAGSFGGGVDALLLSSDDTAQVNVFVYILNGAEVRPLGIVAVPITAGDASNVANIDALAGTGFTLIGLPRDPATGRQYIPLAASEVLKISCLSNMTAAKKCYGTALGLDYEA